MSVTLDILRAWRNPRGVLRARLAEGVREDRALATVMGACFLIFVSRWPELSRMAHLDPSVPLEARLGTTLFVMLFVVPLVLYLVAAVSHLIARLFGGRGNWFSSRLALFWALLALTPAMLLLGLVRGFLGEGGSATTLGGVVFAGFLYLWISMLYEAERE
jgi:hypothetical protein